jgi:hypothetical protein
MIDLTDKQRADFHYLSYTRVDGLWFMKVEEKYGFDEALEIDSQVWKVMPKIQARMLKALCKVADDVEALLECLSTKLTIDNHTYRIEKIGTDGGFRILIEKCPWYELMVNAGRGHLAAKVGDKICNAEYSTWASEFDNRIRFQMKEQLCNGSQFCVLEYTLK